MFELVRRECDLQVSVGLAEQGHARPVLGEVDPGLLCKGDPRSLSEGRHLLAPLPESSSPGEGGGGAAPEGHRRLIGTLAVAAGQETECQGSALPGAFTSMCPAKQQQQR